MSFVKEVKCPQCNKVTTLKKDKSGKWVATFVGASVGSTVGYAVAMTLGLAGTILTFPISIPAGVVGATLVGIIGALGGHTIVPARVVCPNCQETFAI